METAGNYWNSAAPKKWSKNNFIEIKIKNKNYLSFYQRFGILHKFYLLLSIVYLPRRNRGIEEVIFCTVSRSFAIIRSKPRSKRQSRICRWNFILVLGTYIYGRDEFECVIVQNCRNGWGRRELCCDGQFTDWLLFVGFAVRKLHSHEGSGWRETRPFI